MNYLVEINRELEFVQAWSFTDESPAEAFREGLYWTPQIDTNNFFVIIDRWGNPIFDEFGFTDAERKLIYNRIIKEIGEQFEFVIRNSDN